MHQSPIYYLSRISARTDERDNRHHCRTLAELSRNSISAFCSHVHLFTRSRSPFLAIQPGNHKRTDRDACLDIVKPHFQQRHYVKHAPISPTMQYCIAWRIEHIFRFEILREIFFPRELCHTVNIST